MADDCIEVRRYRRSADLSLACGRYRLDFLRLGGAALFHADHHLRVRALFRDPCGAGSGDGTVVVGLCHGGCRHDDRAAVAGAGRDCGRQRPPQAVDRRFWRAAGDRCLADVDRQARRRRRHSALVARVFDCDHRRRIRHRLQQCDDADAGAAGSDRAIVRHRLGDRLCRRHPQPRAGARLSRGRSGERAHAVRIEAAVRARSRHPSGRPHRQVP